MPKVLILLHHILFSFEHESNANMLQLPKDNSNYNFYILWILLLDVYIFKNYSETTYRVINIDWLNPICFIFAARHFFPRIIFMVEKCEHFDIWKKKSLFLRAPLWFCSFFKFGFSWKFDKWAKSFLKKVLFKISKCTHFSTIKIMGKKSGNKN